MQGADPGLDSAIAGALPPTRGVAVADVAGQGSGLRGETPGKPKHQKATEGKDHSFLHARFLSFRSPVQTTSRSPHRRSTIPPDGTVASGSVPPAHRLLLTGSSSAIHLAQKRLRKAAESHFWCRFGTCPRRRRWSCAALPTKRNGQRRDYETGLSCASIRNLAY